MTDLADSDPQSMDAPGDSPVETPTRLKYKDADFLKIVADERRRSVGFGDGGTGVLAQVRIKAQEYRQGEIRDLKTLEGRSKAVDTTLSEAVDTIMPDVMEVFFGGDDVVTFDAMNEQDEGQAREESDAVAHMVFSRNDAFRAFHDAFQDAFYNRTGLFHWWWEDATHEIGEQQADDEGQANALGALAQMQQPWVQPDVQQRDDGSYAVSLSELRGKVCFKAIPSEDFTVAADAVALRDAAYCALRDRPRVQDLIARGVDAKLARSLPHYTSKQDAMEYARDEAGENQRSTENGIDDLRVVEVRTHYIRMDADDDGDLEIWRVETDSEERILLGKEVVSQIPFGALTPYLTAHRFYGESLFDKLQEVMRIKTALLRMLLDSGFFALNQRFEVADQGSNEFTIADLLNNAPNVPVRVAQAGTIRPLTAGALNFDVFAAMEFMSTVAEQRSGVVRNAQGLNPDTLHDTAEGAMQLISAAQKRIKMICRVFAETGIKDLFLGVHQMMREQCTDQHAPTNMKAGPAWKAVKPQTWPERQALTVHVGVGSSGTDKNLQVQMAILNLTKDIVGMQGGLNGPIVTADNAYNRLRAVSRAAGEKDPDQFWTNPQSAQGQQAMQAQAQKPNPQMAEIQGKLQLAQAESQAKLQQSQAQAQADMQLRQAQAASDAQLEHARAQADAAADAQKAQNDHAQQMARIQGELQLKREQLAAELEMKREALAAELAMKRELGHIQAHSSHALGMAKVTASVNEPKPGGEPG